MFSITSLKEKRQIYKILLYEERKREETHKEMNIALQKVITFAFTGNCGHL